MSAKYKQLISFEKVTDHDCGNYTIGEIDVHSSCLEEYLEEHGDKGFNELTQALVYAGERILSARRLVAERRPVRCDEAIEK